jgi:hypothetical protein
MTMAACNYYLRATATALIFFSSAAQGQTKSELNDSLKDECQVFLEWFEQRVHDGRTVTSTMLNFHDGGINGVPYKVLDWCAKHRLVKIK